MNIKWNGALLISAVTLAAAAQQQPGSPNTGNLPPGGVPPDLRQFPPNAAGLNRQQAVPPDLTNNPAMLPAYRFGRMQQQYRTNGSPQLPTNTAAISTPAMGPNTAVIGTNAVAMGTNTAAAIGTNTAAMGTNAAPGVAGASALSSNRFGSAIAPMSPLASTNRIYVTNAYTLAPRAPSSVVMQDQAATVADQKLLVNLRTRIPVVVNAGTAAGVHLIAKDGTVTLVGTIPTERESQRIAEMIQRTPGVTQVINQLQLASGEAVGSNSDTGSVGNLAPSGTGNLVPTGPTNGNRRVYPGGAHTLPPRLHNGESPPRTLNPPVPAPAVDQTGPPRSAVQQTASVGDADRSR